MQTRKLRNGITVLDGDSHIGKWVEESGKLDHDEFLVPLICSYISEGHTVIDVGAYLGDHTMAYIRAVGVTGHVVAFEPNKDAYQCLLVNCGVRGGQLGGHTFLNAAAGSYDGVVKFNLHPENYGASTVSEHPISPEEAVHIIRIDDLQLEGLDVMKIDAEGFEVEVLKGAITYIKSHLPTMFIEVSDHNLRKNGTSRDELYHMLTDELGYNIKPVATNTNLYSEMLDIICTPVV